MKSSLVNLVWERAQGHCEYCQIPQACDELTFEIDHVIAQKHRGTTTSSNLALACSPVTIINQAIYRELIPNRAESFASFIRAA
jgi:hypothetical protein